MYSLNNTVIGGSAGPVFGSGRVLGLGFGEGGAGTAAFRNNMVRLGLDAVGNSIITGFSIASIRDKVRGTATYYFNSMHISDTVC
jgi:hypothetical protein